MGEESGVYSASLSDESLPQLSTDYTFKPPGQWLTINEHYSKFPVHGLLLYANEHIYNYMRLR